LPHVPRSLRHGLLLAASTAALILAGCGGGKSSSSTTSSTPSTSSGATGPKQGVPLSSPAAHAALVSAISRSPDVPPGQADPIASCAIAKLQAEHYTTVDVPAAAATQAGKSCAEQVLGGIDSPVTHRVLLDRIRKTPHVNLGQANQITDCVIARFRSGGYTSISTVPAPVATKAGQDCARRVVRH